jgi:hypothetical protein
MKLTVGVGRLLSRVSLVGRSKFGPSSSWIEWRHLVVNCRGLKRETHKNSGFSYLVTMQLDESHAIFRL